ncbi:MAG: DNA replication/repair protein RecF [Myxococcota bacterium]
MRIEKLHLQNFRNIASAQLDTNRQFIVFSGNNGEGKTNVLESVFMLASLRSFREPNTPNVISAGESIAHIDAHIRSENGFRKLHWAYEAKRGRLLEVDGVPVTKVLDWFKPIRAILFHPGDIDIVRGGPKERRRFLDRARFTSVPAYLTVVQQYNRILNQKKALLKQQACDSAQVKIWNEGLIEYGVKMAIQRQLILQQLQDPFQHLHSVLTGQKEQVTLKLSGIAGHPVDEIRGVLTDALAGAVEREILQKKSLVGPHFDDMNIAMDGFLAKKYASQGQARSISIALKLAELMSAKARGEHPLLLLDDLSSELDRNRTQKLVQILSESDSQIWITTTEPSHLGPIPASNLRRFVADRGQIKEA